MHGVNTDQYISMQTWSAGMNVTTSQDDRRLSKTLSIYLPCTFCIQVKISIVLRGVAILLSVRVCVCVWRVCESPWVYKYVRVNCVNVFECVSYQTLIIQYDILKTSTQFCNLFLLLFFFFFPFNTRRFKRTKNRLNIFFDF